MSLKLNDEEAKKLLTSNKLIVLDFFAVWCHPCGIISPIIDKLSDKYSDKVTIAKIDIEECDDMVNMYNIRNVPTVLFIKDGEVKDRLVGVHPESVFEDKIINLIS